jgi:hypothetical protein
VKNLHKTCAMLLIFVTLLQTSPLQADPPATGGCGAVGHSYAKPDGCSGGCLTDSQCWIRFAYKDAERTVPAYVLCWCGSSTQECLYSQVTIPNVYFDKVIYDCWGFSCWYDMEMSYIPNDGTSQNVAETSTGENCSGS